MRLMCMLFEQLVETRQTLLSNTVLWVLMGAIESARERGDQSAAAPDADSLRCSRFLGSQLPAAAAVQVVTAVRLNLELHFGLTIAESRVAPWVGSTSGA